MSKKASSVSSTQPAEQAAVVEVKPRLTLADLQPAKGSNKSKLRVGRGRATGAGKTCNRGHNGEGQRSGRSRKRGFEGGQMPGYRQMPKIDGFRLANQRQWLELNVGDIEGMLPLDQTDLNEVWLRDHGYLRLKHDGVRLLGKGELKRKVVIEVTYASPSARQKVEAAGGTITTIATVTAE